QRSRNAVESALRPFNTRAITRAAAAAPPIAPCGARRYVGADMSIGDWWRTALDSPVSTETLLVIAVGVVLIVRSALHRSRIGRRLDAGLTLLVVGLLALALGTAASAEGALAVIPYARAVCVAALAIAAVRIAMVLLIDIYLREQQHARVSAIV